MLRPAARTADPGERAAGIAAVKIILDDVLDDRTEIAVRLLETLLRFRDEALKASGSIYQPPIFEHNARHQARRARRHLHAIVRHISALPDPARNRNELQGWDQVFLNNPSLLDIFHRCVFPVQLHRPFWC